MSERNYDLLKSKFSEFFLPTLFTSVAGNICVFVDSLLISFFLGAGNISAVLLATPLITFVNLIYWMIGIGGSVLCSVSKAEFDNVKSNYYFTISIGSLVVIGFLVAIIGTIFSAHIVNLLCVSQPDLSAQVSRFYNVLLWGMPFLCYMMSISYFIRVDGNPKLPFRAILLANIINLCCDVIFMHFMGMGIAGAALATDIGYICGAVFISMYFFKKERTLEFIRVRIRPILYYLKDMARAGFSSSSTHLNTTIKLFVMNYLLGIYLGKSGLVAYGVCYNSLFILTMFLIGTSQTMSPIVSVYFKEGDYSGVNYVVRRSLKIVLISSFVLAALFIIYPKALLLLYSVNDPSDIPVVFNAVRIYAISYMGTAVTFLYTFYAQAIQKRHLATIISFIEGCLVPVSAAFVLSYFFGGDGIWFAFTVAEAVTIIFLVVFSKVYARKTGGEYSGFFINKHNDDRKVFEYTVRGDVGEAVGLARDVQSYLSGRKSAALVGLAIEDMLVNIIDINEKVDAIDVIVRNNDDDILVSIVDTGIGFNPVVENENLEFDNISVLNKIAKEIDYSRVLGLNSTVIIIDD